MRVFFVAAFALVVWMASALAGDPSGTPPSSALSATRRSAWGAGREHYEEGDFALDHVPLDMALATLAEQTSSSWSVNEIEVEWDVLASAGVAKDKRVSVRLWSPKLSKVLQVTLDHAAEGTKAHLTFYAGGERIIVTTRERHLARDGVTREYNIRRFLRMVVEDDPAIDDQKSENNQKSPARGGLFGNSGDGGREWVITRKERIAAIIELFKETIDPDSWSDPKTCFIRAEGDRLVIRQVEENQKLIVNLFEQLDETRMAARLDVLIRPTSRPTTRPLIAEPARAIHSER
jgi:hypothetical protein